ncbi:TAXI family TRAP transporter solute-binding subunit [Marinobacterium rhizophilum]|uniref:TAXI family TRAP transporter solute-binding subunit n=1 Tax=Marinobacterium rhizophilum TaxID=420402 RepID=UPI0003668536|nr:TAXI family TRAP transporter solute-binding subunit [Marinobacterium rhizophilum]
MKLTTSLLACAITTHLALTAPLIQAQTLRAESGNPATFNSQLATMMSKYASQEHGMSIQLNTGQALSMTGVKVGSGRIDLTMIPTELYTYMGEGSQMYAGMGDQAVKAAENIRSLFGYVHGAYHIFTWADSGITNWSDIAGKNVYIGPSSSASSLAIEQVIKANTGMSPGEGYNAITMGWGASGQAFSDGQIDVLVSGAQIGSSSIEQYSLVKPIRFLGVTEAGKASESWQTLIASPAMQALEINKDTYANTVNNDDAITLLAFTMMTIVNRTLSDEDAYQLTQSFWDNAAEIRGSGPTFKSILIDNAFVGVNAPLHQGAYRYYLEQGIDVPEHLRPRAE